MIDESGIAIASEYVVLLGISLLIFTAVFIGLSSFSNTASEDASAKAAYDVAALVGERMSAAAGSQSSVVVDIDLPERICGRIYLVYPSEDSRVFYVLVGRETYEAPLIIPEDVKVGGFMVSVPGTHRIVYQSSSKTLTMA